MLLKYTFFILTVNFTGISGLYDACTQNSDCSSNAICMEGKCQCDLMSIDDDGICLSIVTEYNGYCQKDTQCRWLGNNAKCIKSTCKCDNGFRWFRGECVSYVGFGDTCSSSEDCFDGLDPFALTCSKEKRCYCSDNYYLRGSNCRLSSEDDDCAINYDCDSTEKLGRICHLGKCVNSNELSNTLFLENEDVIKEETYSREKNQFWDEKVSINCTRDKDCLNMANSICNDNTHTCECKNSGFFIYNDNCLQGLGKCTNNETCDSVSENSYCLPTAKAGVGVCICKRGYFYKNNECIPELGMRDVTLVSATDCKIRPSKIVDSACYCKNYWFGDDTNRNCIKTTLQQTYSCLTNDWCNAMGPYSYCNSSNLCQCSSFATFDENAFYCNADTPATDVCLRDSDCGYNQRCMNEQCSCINNFSITSDGECLPDIGGSCEIKTCNVNFSVCVGGLCSCDTNYKEYNNNCLEVVSSWNDTCEVTEQCEYFKFSECSHRSHKCKCIAGYQKEADEECWQLKDYGDPCMTSEQCTMVLNRSYQCRNNKCVCAIGQTLQNGYCVLNSSFHLLSSSFLLYSLLLGTIFI